jgi:hypothetical protein
MLTDTELAAGLVWRAAGDAGAQGAHVLIVGVDSYPEKSGFAPLTSPVASARTIAGWFLGAGRDGVTPLAAGADRFTNPASPLASLAVLLSESAPDAKFAGHSCRRATRKNLEEAAQAWLLRAEANDSNLAIVYFCGHGVQDNNKTVFVLEDRDPAQDKTNARNGFADLRTFAGNLRGRGVTSQLLLFDCCRDDHSRRLPEQGSVGYELVDGGSLNLKVQQMVLYATEAFAKATGRVGRTSIFAESFLMSMAHVAVDTSVPGRPVRSGKLYGSMQDCLKLFTTGKSPLQKLDADSMADFVIHKPSINLRQVPTYVHMADPAKWSDATISRVLAGEDPVELPKEPAGERFLATSVEMGRAVAFVAEHDEDVHKLEIDMPLPPVFFACIGAQAQPEVTVAAIPATRSAQGPVIQTFGIPSPAGRGGGVRAALVPTGRIVVQIVRNGAYDIANPIVSIDPVEDGARTIEIGLDAAEKGVPVKPGLHLVELALPDGQTPRRGVEVKPGRIVTVTFALEGSGHEWLSPAVAAGVIEARDTRNEQRLARFATPPFAIAPMDFRLAFAAADTGVSPAGGDILVDIHDDSDDRFRKANDGSIRHKPAWIGVETEEELFAVAVPATGRSQPWLSPKLVATHRDGGGVAPAVVTPDPEFNALFAVLGRRDFPRLKPMLRDIRNRSEAYSRIVDDSNAMASAGAAIANLAVGDDPLTLDAAWHGLFVAMHPSLPDGPILAARHLWVHDVAGARRDEMKRLLLEGFRRGVPVFALALDWLRSGLAQFEDDPAAKDAAAKVEAAVRRSVADTAFTILGFPREKGDI